MSKHVEDLMMKIVEKNSIIKTINTEKRCRMDQVEHLTCELDCLLYEFYKSMIDWVRR